MKRPSFAFAVTAVVTLAMIAIGVLSVVRIVELFPLDHDVTPANSYGDDWYTYHRYATSVLLDGLHMPVVTDAYFRPAGFGYPYFVAAIYALVGVRSDAVYLVQALLLATSIGWAFVLFRERVSRLAALGLLGALTFVMYVDVYRSLTFRLLSENVVFIVWPALLFLCFKAVSTGRLVYALVCGVVAGVGFLMRPNLALVAPVVAALILRYATTQSIQWRTRAAALLLAACLAVSSLMALRNYAVTGHFTFTALTRTSDWWVTRQFTRDEPTAVRRALRTLESITSRTLYMVGIPYLRQPTFRPRPHWLVLWVGFLWYLRTIRGRPLPFWERVTLGLAFAYFIPIVTLGYVSNYGVRNLAPGLPLIVILGVRGVELTTLRQKPA